MVLGSSGTLGFRRLWQRLTRSVDARWMSQHDIRWCRLYSAYRESGCPPVPAWEPYLATSDRPHARIAGHLGFCSRFISLMPVVAAFHKRRPLCLSVTASSASARCWVSLGFSSVCLASGVALGREGPSVQIGARPERMTHGYKAASLPSSCRVAPRMPA